MEALGLIDAIIATVSDSPKPIFSKTKIIIEEELLIQMLEKLKAVVQSDGEAARRSVASRQQDDLPVNSVSRLAETNPQIFGAEGEALLRQAKDEAERMRGAADQYAKNVLTNLQVVVTKMMRTLENGKERLDKYKEHK